jgi:nitrate reductase gamma subunit
MFESLFDIPLWIAGTLIIAVLCAFAVAGLLLVRRRVLRRLRVESGDSEFTGSMLQSVMVFYGLAVALITITVFQTYSDTSKVVTGEAILSLDRPFRGDLGIGADPYQLVYDQLMKSNP